MISPYSTPTIATTSQHPILDFITSLGTIKGVMPVPPASEKTATTPTTPTEPPIKFYTIFTQPK